MDVSSDSEYTLWSVGNNCFDSGPFHKIAKFTKPKIKKVINAKDGTTFVTLDDQTFSAFGSNKHGQLGLTTQNKEIKSITYCNRIKIENIFSGITAYHAFKLTLDNKLYAAGWNKYKQLGIKTKTESNPEWCLIDNLPIKHKIKDIAAGYRYTIILTENGEIFECGRIIQTVYNTFEKVDVENSVKFKGVKCGACHTLLIDIDDNLWSFGLNNHGQLGLGNNNEEYHPIKVKFFSDKNIKMAQIGCGADHNLVLEKDNGNVYCWGDNKKFQCGTGSHDTKSYNIPQTLVKLERKTIVGIKCGRHHNVVKTNDDEWYLWGYNEYNQCLSYVLSDHLNTIQIPRKFVPRLLGKDQEIVDIFPGDNDTKVVTKQIPLSRRKKKKIKKAMKLDNYHQNHNHNGKVIDLTEENDDDDQDDDIQDIDQDDNDEIDRNRSDEKTEEEQDEDLENEEEEEEKQTIQYDDDAETEIGNDLLSKQEMETKENEWNELDPDWKSTWPKHRCQKILNDESKDSENIKDYARMYLKYWQTMEHYNENSNNSISNNKKNKANKRKRQRNHKSIDIDTNTNVSPPKKRRKVSNGTNKNRNTNIDDEELKKLYEKEVELNRLNKSRILELEKQVNELKQYRALYHKLQIVAAAMRDRSLNGRDPRREYKSSKCVDGIERTDEIKEWKKDVNDFFNGLYLSDHNVKITEWESKLKKFLEINKNDRDFTNPITTFKNYRFNDMVEKFMIKAPNRITALINQEGIRTKLNFKDKAIPKGTILGRYIGIEMTVKEWNDTFVDSHQEYRNQQYLYSFDVDEEWTENDNDKKEDGEKLNDEDIRRVIVDPLEGGKKDLLLLYLNDCRKDIFSNVSTEDARYQNCAFLNARVDGWPTVFIVTTKRIPAGIELLIDYGKDYGIFVSQNKKCREMIEKAKTVTDDNITKYLGTKLHEKHNGAELYDLSED